VPRPQSPPVAASKASHRSRVSSSGVSGQDKNVLVYVAYSDRVITGSPQNSISAVPLMPWGTVPAKTL
jgi:catabolite regulation protein CreA